MQFKSNFKCFQAIVRHGHTIYHPVTGTKTGEVKALVAEFGIHSGEYTVHDPATGKDETFADIRGFFFDSDEAAKREKWTPEEKEAVEARLLELAERWPEAVQLHSAPVVAPPFPTYDDVEADAVAQLCVDLGLTEQAIAYETANENRPKVVAVLQKAIVPVAEELTAA